MRAIRDRQKHIRSIETNLQTRSEQDSDEKVIEGYFVVFNSETELFPGGFEEVAPTAFASSLSNDIRALVNHNDSIVLGRNKSNTLELKVDGRGLWGSIKINENDSDAMNLYERVKRGDVDQCSFGFRILKEEEEFRDDGSIKWTIKEADLHEISVVTFPAYADTSVQARKEQRNNLNKRSLDKQKLKLKERLKNVT